MPMHPLTTRHGRAFVAITDSLCSGVTQCFGSSWDGQLGYDNQLSVGKSTGDMAALGAVNLGASVTFVTTGASFSCAVLADNQAKCWGQGSSGQLGQDSTDNIGDGAGEMAALWRISTRAQPCLKMWRGSPDLPAQRPRRPYPRQASVRVCGHVPSADTGHAAAHF